MENLKQLKNPTTKVPVFLNIDEVAIIGDFGRNFAYETVKEIKELNPEVRFNRSRVPSNLLVKHLGIMMEQAEQRLFEFKNKNNSL